MARWLSLFLSVCLAFSTTTALGEDLQLTIEFLSSDVTADLDTTAYKQLLGKGPTFDTKDRLEIDQISTIGTPLVRDVLVGVVQSDHAFEIKKMQGLSLLTGQGKVERREGIWRLELKVEWVVEDPTRSIPGHPGREHRWTDVGVELPTGRDVVVGSLTGTRQTKGKPAVHRHAMFVVRLDEVK